MSDHRNPGGGHEQPQAVVGPITLGLKREGASALTIAPHSMVGPAALQAALGSSTIQLIKAASTSTAIHVTVNCAGAQHVLVITGAVLATETFSFTPGTVLIGIANTGTAILVQGENGSQAHFVSFAIDGSAVTVSLGT